MLRAEGRGSGQRRGGPLGPGGGGLWDGSRPSWLYVVFSVVPAIEADLSLWSLLVTFVTWLLSPSAGILSFPLNCSSSAALCLPEPQTEHLTFVIGTTASFAECGEKRFPQRGAMTDALRPPPPFPPPSHAADAELSWALTFRLPGSAAVLTVAESLEGGGRRALLRWGPKRCPFHRGDAGPEDRHRPPADRCSLRAPCAPGAALGVLGAPSRKSEAQALLSGRFLSTGVSDSSASLTQLERPAAGSAA